MLEFRTLLELRDHLAIRDHVAGRIQLRFSSRLLKDPRTEELRRAADAGMPPCIKDIKVNLFTRTLTVHYDTTAIVPEELHEALITEDRDRFEELASRFDEPGTV